MKNAQIVLCWATWERDQCVELAQTDIGLCLRCWESITGGPNPRSPTGTSVPTEPIPKTCSVKWDPRHPDPLADCECNLLVGHVGPHECVCGAQYDASEGDQ